VPETIQPALGLKSFNCPHCHALAHQSWFSAFAYHLKEPPQIISKERVDRFRKDLSKDLDIDTASEAALAWGERQLLGLPFLHKENSRYADQSIALVHVSKCFSCSELSIWMGDKVVYPFSKVDVHPSPDMPRDAAADYIEASEIFESSPRGAAALLRLALQKILISLGETGRNIDTDIGSLVKKGLSAQVQQALDVVRVTGNHLVHPGQIDSADTKEAALRLFSLLNIITEAMITQPRQIKEMFGELPSGALEAIERRDRPKELAPPNGK